MGIAFRVVARCVIVQSFVFIRGLLGDCSGFPFSLAISCIFSLLLPLIFNSGLQDLCSAIVFPMYPMPQISGKRAAPSPLSSEFDKKPRLGLTDEQRKKLKQNLDFVSDLPVSSPEDVKTNYLMLALREVATHTSIIEKFWEDANIAKEHIDRLSSKDRLELASIWIGASKSGDWSGFADYVASLHVGLPSAVGGTHELIEDLSPRVSTVQSQSGLFCLVLNTVPI